jgi:cation:H+ antiporter
MVIFWTIVLILSIIAIVKGADWFTEGAESIGIRFGIPSFVVGIIIVSFGTSLPELASSISAVLHGTTEIVVANIVGSNIANLLFVLGLAGIIATVKTDRNFVRKDIPVLVGSTLLLLLFSLDGTISRWEALIFLAATAIYIIKGFSTKNIPVEDHFKGKKIGLILVGGLTLVIAGAHFLVEAVIYLSLEMGISMAVISASIVAFGTSIPEAVVSIVAVLKKQKDIALGNIVGSNVFNIFLIGGVSGVLAPLVVSPIILVMGIPVLIGATLLMAWWMNDKKFERHEGVAFLVLYGLFILALYVQTP